tara:strand:+ start:556 stop:714 length:159 start_codon:yes stop_codon:yes gene_type:complete
METLNQKLKRLGYTTADAGNYRKHIYKKGLRVFTGNAYDCWKWLKEQHPDDK